MRLTYETAKTNIDRFMECEKKPEPEKKKPKNRLRNKRVHRLGRSMRNDRLRLSGADGRGMGLSYRHSLSLSALIGRLLFNL